MDAKGRLEYLRGELRAERISYGELIELQGLVQYIEEGDVELLEAAGVPEGETHSTPRVTKTIELDAEECCIIMDLVGIQILDDPFYYADHLGVDVEVIERVARGLFERVSATLTSIQSEREV